MHMKLEPLIATPFSVEVLASRNDKNTFKNNQRKPLMNSEIVSISESSTGVDKL